MELKKIEVNGSKVGIALADGCNGPHRKCHQLPCQLFRLLQSDCVMDMHEIIASKLPTVKRIVARRENSTMYNE